MPQLFSDTEIQSSLKFQWRAFVVYPSNAVECGMKKICTNFKHPKQTWFFRRWRKHRGYTQEELADMVGMATSSISQLERGEQGFSDHTLIVISEALNCTPADLLARDPKSDNDPLSVWRRIKEDRRDQALKVLSTFADDDITKSA
jgi:transcriptional regulator with XRE-family HTH domain